METLLPQLQTVYQEHPWLHYHPDTITTYLPPDYYDRLLKKYTFSGKSDLGYFQDYVNKHFRPRKEDVLEMGFGSGRATDLLVDGDIGFHSLDLVDLSSDMVAHGREKYADILGVSIFEDDILDYLQSSTRSYSAAFSLWGFSYSVHHHMNELGIKAGTKYAESVISKFITQNLRCDGSIFIVHPDILSQQKRLHIQLIKGFDPNTLSYPCAYLNPELGLMASFLYSLNTLTRWGTKHIQWDDDTDSRLVQMRYLNFDLLNLAYRYFTESTSVHSLETQLVTNLLPWYQKAIGKIGIDEVVEDFQDNFADEFERNKSVFLV